MIEEPTGDFDPVHLRPCPFCGSEHVRLRENPLREMAWVACIDCGLQSPTETGTRLVDAKAYWNKRVVSYDEMLASVRRYIFCMEWEGVRGEDNWLDRVDQAMADLRAELSSSDPL
jgi:Lar family restriction alleviation protein